MDTEREQLRERELGALSPRYSPVLHVLAPSAWGLAVVAAAAFLIHGLTWTEALTVPIVLVLANMAEWRMHRDLLHKRSALLPALYDRHTPVHHRIYVYGDMEIKTSRELKFILIPAWAGIALFVALLPLAVGIWFSISANVACLFISSCMVYVVCYELLHLSYHLPAASFLGRRALVRRLARHHSIHHDPKLMHRWNMNVSVPLWDVVRRTRVRAPACDDVHKPETTVGTASASR